MPVRSRLAPALFVPLFLSLLIHAQNKIALMQDIDVPPGDIYLRSGIYDPASNRAGMIEIPLSGVSLAKVN